jgi:hypothetical protein
MIPSFIWRRCLRHAAPWIPSRDCTPPGPGGDVNTVHHDDGGDRRRVDDDGRRTAAPVRRLLMYPSGAGCEGVLLDVARAFRYPCNGRCDGGSMKRVAALVLVAMTIFGVAGCAPKSTSSSKPASTSASSGTKTPGHLNRPSFTLNKDLIYEHVTKTYNPADFAYAPMDGEPSQIPFFKPIHDEGKLNRDYPSYSAKTFKFLELSTVGPGDYYMFHANDGGTLNAALKGTGYNAVDILDGGHQKILPNLYIGYYDFAWVTTNVMSEYWSGNESMNQELWKKGDDYVIIGAEEDAASPLYASAKITSLKQLAGQTVGIMNPSFNDEMLLNNMLKTVGLATASAGGNVKVQMASPGFVLDDLLALDYQAAFAWSKYASTLTGTLKYHVLVPWQAEGYSERTPDRVLVVRRDILEKHPDIVQKVVQANYDATKLALASNAWQAPAYALSNAFKMKYYGTPAPKTKPGTSKPDAQANPAFLQDTIDYMTQCDYFKVPYTYAHLVDQSFYDKVKK